MWKFIGAGYAGRLANALFGKPGTNGRRNAIHGILFTCIGVALSAPSGCVTIAPSVNSGPGGDGGADGQADAPAADEEASDDSAVADETDESWDAADEWDDAESDGDASGASLEASPQGPTADANDGDGNQGPSCSAAEPCSALSFCSNGTCKPVWTEVSHTTFDSAPVFSASAGTILYFSSLTSMSGFDTSSQTFGSYPAEPGLAYGAVLAGGTFGNGVGLVFGVSGLVSTWQPGATTWSTTAASPPTGFSALGVLGSKVYVVPGSGQAYAALLPAGAAWTPAGLLPSGQPIDDACTASDTSHSNMYVFGGFGSSGPAGAMYMYSQASGAWSTLAAMAPGSCTNRTAPVWNGQIAYADGQAVYLFDIASSTWVTPLPLPSGTWQYLAALSPAGTDLYLLTYDGTSVVVFKYAE